MGMNRGSANLVRWVECINTNCSGVKLATRLVKFEDAVRGIEAQTSGLINHVVKCQVLPYLEFYNNNYWCPHI